MTNKLTGMTSKLAEACVKVAEANHYLVGVIGVFTIDEYFEAEQELIDCELVDPNAADFDTAFLVLFNKRKEEHKF